MIKRIPQAGYFTGCIIYNAVEGRIKSEMNQTTPLAIAHNFSAAFEQMCSIMAIGKTRDRGEVLSELVLQCLVFLPNEKFSSASEIMGAIDCLLGIRIPEHEIQFALDKMIEAQSISINSDGIFSVHSRLKKDIQQAIDETHSLDKNIREDWEKEVKSKYLKLDFDRLWKVLRVYLAGAFQRHGIQAVALLDPGIEIPIEYSESLSSILQKVINQEFEINDRVEAKVAISEFMATTGNHPKRARYISQLADGAFNYYSLTIDPKTASDFQKNLNPLDLFFDTNFLFGILDITVNPQVAVSNELIAAIKKYNLPFKLYSHKKTVTELLDSINNYSEILGEKNWSRQISRAAAYSRHLSGVELRYHQRFAEEGIDVESFFRPYRHSDVLLKKKGIIPYVPQNNRIAERSALIEEYKEFLEKIKKEKYYEQIDHDVTVLDIVRQKRTNVKSSLEAGALFITCDYTLYKFDWETSKEKGICACTVLPNIFWQILRPFIPSDVDFDKSFAETFAIPEFRIFGSKASLACSKMLNILAGYKDFPEETAKRLLSNDMLIESLQHASDEKMFQDLVETEIVKENATLLEEKEKIVAHYEKEKDDTEQKLETQILRGSQLEREIEKIKKSSQSMIEQERYTTRQSEQKAKDAKEEAKREKEKVVLLLGIVKMILLSVACVAIFEFSVYKCHFIWLIEHQNSISIQITIDSLFILISSAIFLPKWRKWIIGSAIVPFIIGLIQILGK